MSRSITVGAALAMALGLLLGQIFFRPLWRDEYWALFFSAPDDTIPSVLQTMKRDVHPPLYFVLLHVWRQVFEAEVFARLFNIAVMILAGAAAWGLRGQRPRETATWLFLCATSFWLVFYSAEIRMMGPLFCLSGLATILVRNAFDKPEQTIRYGALFAGVGMLAASSHFFGTVWIGSLGLAAGLISLGRGRIRAFLTFGVASTVAILPAVLWIVIAKPHENPGAPDTVRPFLENLELGANQFLRGLIVKTVFANLFAVVAGVLGWAALFGRRSDDTPRVMALAIGLTVGLVFAVHLGWVALIKERAFIVIIPALLYLLAEGLCALRDDQKKAMTLARYVPLAALVSLPLFSSEFFKDREKIGEIRQVLAAHPECAGERVAAYLRPSEQNEDYPLFFTRETLKGATGAGDIVLVPLADYAAAPYALTETRCPVKLVAIGLPRGTDDAEHRDMRADILASGFPAGALEELRLGGGRTFAYVSRESE